MNEEGERIKENTAEVRHCPLPKFSPWVTVRWGAHAKMFPWGAPSIPDFVWFWYQQLCILFFFLPPAFLSHFLSLTSSLHDSLWRITIILSLFSLCYSTYQTNTCKGYFIRASYLTGYRYQARKAELYKV